MSICIHPNCPGDITRKGVCSRSDCPNPDNPRQPKTVTEEKTRVIFRRWSKQRGGGIIAVFPRDLGDYDPYHCSSYEHIGQHGSCDPAGVMLNSHPVKPRDYADLMSELEGLGYVLDVRQRTGRADLEYRKGELASLRSASGFDALATDEAHHPKSKTPWKAKSD